MSPGGCSVPVSGWTMRASCPETSLPHVVRRFVERDRWNEPSASWAHASVDPLPETSLTSGIRSCIRRRRLGRAEQQHDAQRAEVGFAERPDGRARQARSCRTPASPACSARPQHLQGASAGSNCAGWQKRQPISRQASSGTIPPMWIERQAHPRRPTPVPARSAPGSSAPGGPVASWVIRQPFGSAVVPGRVHDHRDVWRTRLRDCSRAMSRGS